MNGKSNDSHSTWVDPEDAPEITDKWIAHAALYHGEKLVRRGHPKAEVTKDRITIRLSHDVVERFRVTGDGWQTRIDAALKDWLRTHEPQEA